MNLIGSIAYHSLVRLFIVNTSPEVDLFGKVCMWMFQLWSRTPHGQATGYLTLTSKSAACVVRLLRRLVSDFTTVGTAGAVFAPAALRCFAQCPIAAGPIQCESAIPAPRKINPPPLLAHTFRNNSPVVLPHPNPLRYSSIVPQSHTLGSYIHVKWIKLEPSSLRRKITSSSCFA